MKKWVILGVVAAFILTLTGVPGEKNAYFLPNNPDFEQITLNIL